jgi:NADPH2:quinone reductase
VRAVMLREFGPPENLLAVEVADPAPPGPGQVLVDVHIANITFVETQIRAGRPPNPAMAPSLPAVLGNGVGGVVVAAGAGVDPALAAPGRRFVTTTGGSGGYAERAVVAAGGLIDVPAGLTLAEAVALLADGRTAVSLLRTSGLRAGEVALVEAAAGGVGSLLVQLARTAGARVVAAAGGSRKVAVAAGLGADMAVDYRAAGWADLVRAEVGAVDVVFDGVGGPVGAAAFGLLGDGGRFCQYGMAGGSFTEVDGEEAAGRGIAVRRGAPLTPAELRELTVDALAMAAAGTLRPVIGQTFPLERAADAHAAIGRRETIGKTLLLTGGPG